MTTLDSYSTGIGSVSLSHTTGKGTRKDKCMRRFLSAIPAITATLAATGAGVLLIPAAARAQVVLHPYGLTPPAAFAMATAGQYGGNGIGPFSFSNRVTNNSDDDFHLSIGPGPQSASASHVVVPGNSATATTLANFGIVQFTTSMVDANGSAQSAAGVADGGWVETWLISDPALNGQAGVMTWGLHIDGLLLAGPPTGSSTAQVGIDHAGADVNDQFQIQANTPQFSLAVNQNYTLNTPFTYGTPFEIMVRAVSISRLSGEPPGGNGSSASADFDNTMYWTGIQGFTAGGNPVTPAQVVTGSGTNYFQSFAPSAIAAPEPGTSGLLALGGIALPFASFIRRRRRSR